LYIKFTRQLPDYFFDLYAGVGTFSFLSAKKVPHVICIEESPASLQALRMNASEKSRGKMDIVEGSVEKAFPLEFGHERTGKTMLCLDPPRAGLDKSLAHFLARTGGIAAIAYVSCDPATLVRDLKILLADDRYDLKAVIPFDMFPRTKHIEVAALLTAK